MPTISVENYLKSIHHLQNVEDRVKTKSIADDLEVSLPSVTSMLQALASDGLVDYQPYKGVTLTEKGRTLALNVIRKHRLIEMFLVETLQYTWDEVHAEAELLEHAVSDTLADRIDHFLGHPKFDPHGDPIPSTSGEMHHRDVEPLNTITRDQIVRLARVLNQDPEVLRHLRELGVVPGALIRVRSVIPFDGQMVLDVNGDEVTISKSIASALLVSIEA